MAFVPAGQPAVNVRPGQSQSRSTSPVKPGKYGAGCPQKLTKVTKAVRSNLRFLRLLGVQKSVPQLRRTPFGGLLGFPNLRPIESVCGSSPTRSDPVTVDSTIKFTAGARLAGTLAPPGVRIQDIGTRSDF